MTTQSLRLTLELSWRPEGAPTHSGRAKEDLPTLGAGRRA